MSASHASKPLIAKRNEEIILTYENDTQVTFQYLAQKHGISVRSIKQILRNAGVTLRREPFGRPSLLRLKPLSKGHIWLGHRLDIYMATHHDSMQEFARKVNISTHRLGLARYGAHDFTLSELQSLCSVLKISLPRELIDGVVVAKEKACN